MNLDFNNNLLSTYEKNLRCFCYVKIFQERMITMIMRLASSMQTDSIVDGIGLRTVIWTQGCKHNCKGCHNPQTHAFDGGYETTTEHMEQLLLTLKLQRGITFSGGEPFEQARACTLIAKFAHKIGLDVWAYTGYTFEEIINSENKDWHNFLNEIDVMVDGEFIEDRKSLCLKFRGSDNQRIIDVKQSMDEHKIILLKV